MVAGRRRRRLAAALIVASVASCDDAGDWSNRDRRILQTLTLTHLGPPPADPSNRFSTDPRAIRLGKKLFFDRRLSGDGQRSCATCHQPDKAFADGLARPAGTGPGGRNTPTVIGAAHGQWFYWDGRRDSLWSQALIPFEAAKEMGGSRVAVIHTIAKDPDYRAQFSALIGALPDDRWLDRLPAQAGPYGDPATQAAWHSMPLPDRRRVDRLYAVVGKAIAAYERTLTLEPGPLDRFVDALAERRRSDAHRHLTPSQRRGLALFISDRTRCLRCHNGPRLTNDGFHNIGTGKLEGAGALDFGRVFGLRAFLIDEFNCRGVHSDASADDCHQLRFLNRKDVDHMTGAFKVPSLRLVSKTAPYFHDGRFETLDQVVRFYNAPAPTADGVELAPIGLNDQEIADLVSFLTIL